MARVLFILVLTGIAMVAAAQETDLTEEAGFPQQMSAQDLQHTCGASGLSDTGRQRRRYCVGFISGVEEGVRILKQQHRLELSVCLPEQVSGRALTNVFLKHTADNPTQLKKPAAQAVIDALADKYPCTP